MVQLVFQDGANVQGLERKRPHPHGDIKANLKRYIGSSSLSKGADRGPDFLKLPKLRFDVDPDQDLDKSRLHRLE